MNDFVCEVCNKNPAIGVAASPLGPASFAYCVECLSQHAEPYHWLCTVVSVGGGIDRVVDWVRPIAEATCRITNHTWEQFLKDSAPDMSMREMLTELELWTSFAHSDGYLNFTYTDCGIVTLICGKEVSVPADFLEEAGDPELETGWIGEFSARGIGEGSDLKHIDHFDHIWVFGESFEIMIAKLHAAVQAGERKCDCNTSDKSVPEPSEN